MGKTLPSPTDVERGHNKDRSPPYFCPPPPQPWFPWLVPLIFLVNFVMFGYAMYVNDCPDTRGADQCLFSEYLGRFSFEPFNVNKLFGPSSTTLQDLGGLEKKLVVNDKEGWRLLTCMWLHAGVIHILANMLSLLFIGIRLEKEFGFLSIGLLYVLAGLGGSMASCLHTKLTDRPTISVGASGALFGLLGAMLSELITNWTIYASKCAALLTLVLVIALNLSIGFIPGVDNSAHIGGFISGFFLGFVLLMRPQYGYVNRKYIPSGYHVKSKPRHKCYQYVLLVVALIILILGYAYGFAKIFGGSGSRTESLPPPKFEIQRPGESLPP
ncbi:Rhomboid-like protein [Quillaja saponaria]|uniref:RHOMBOID-like protein n=1 Tax=Quillaja saponaria TaxID=32244 RepID=A0AAD7L618_QUISA|nr:Rhomboid-like protein [Quillaja saponaria]